MQEGPHIVEHLQKDAGPQGFLLYIFCLSVQRKLGWLISPGALTGKG